MYALISTIDLEQPYRFCETSEVKFAVTEPALFWVDCSAGVSPATHTWDGAQFVEIPLPVLSAEEVVSVLSASSAAPTIL
jgi:hypothetical protein